MRRFVRSWIKPRQHQKKSDAGAAAGTSLEIETMNDPLLDMTKPNNWLLQPDAIAELRDFAHGMSVGNLNHDFKREYESVRDALDRLHAVSCRAFYVPCTETESAKPISA